MYRIISYGASLPVAGNFAGQIVVIKPPKGRIRYSVGDLTKETREPQVRVWENSTGQGIAVDVWVDEKAIGADHWAVAESAIRARFPGVEITYRD